MTAEYDDWPESLIKVFESLVAAGTCVSVEYNSGVTETGVLIFYNSYGVDYPGIEFSGAKSLLWVGPIRIQTVMETIWSMERDEPIHWVHLQLGS